MDAARPLAGSAEASGGQRLSGSWSGRQRKSFVEQVAEGGRRCSVAADNFEALDAADGNQNQESSSFPDQVRGSFENLKRETLLDPGYVEELQTEEPSRLAWLRSSGGLIVQLTLFLVYVGLDCGKTIFNSMALKGDLAIVPQSLPICQSALQIVLGIVCVYAFLGRELVAEVFNGKKILKFFPISLIFAMAQAFQTLAYTVISGGTIKILGQVRLLQTALLSKFLLGRNYVMNQWLVISMIVMSAGIFCQAKMEDKTHWDCYKALDKMTGTKPVFDTVPQACVMGANAEGDATENSDFLKGMLYVFIYLILSDCGSIATERFLNDEDSPYYLQKTWLEIGGLPCAIAMSFVVPLTLQFIGSFSDDGLDRKGPPPKWESQMWWKQDERCSDPDWASQGKNMNFCGGFFRNRTIAAVVALLLSMTHSWLSGLVVKKLNSVIKLMGKCASLALVFFVGDCWLLRKQDPPVLCMIAALMVMTGTFTFMNIKPPKKETETPPPAAPASSSSPSAGDTEMANRS